MDVQRKLVSIPAQGPRISDCVRQPCAMLLRIVAVKGCVLAPLAELEQPCTRERLVSKMLACHILTYSQGEHDAQYGSNDHCVGHVSVM